ncbi:MAG TPA: alpha/beta hydrolase [Solirubrobacterales bacterium]|nr:alpha/beta hydrolase [Solirubrobacterales bacterium]
MERSTPPRRNINGGHKPRRRIDRHNGLAYALWLPDDPPPWPGVVVVHGAGSRKENHADFARLATASGWAVLTFDLPGHGDSEGEMSGAAVDGVLSMVQLLAARGDVDSRRVVVRGSSLGGFLAICAASAGPEVAGVIAICPASEDHLARGVRRGRFEMRVGDPLDLEAWLMAQDVGDSVERIAGRPLILMHAEGDTQIPSEHSEELYERAGEPRKLVIAPGGAHTTVQHDPELQGMALRWLERQLDASRPRS